MSSPIQTCASCGQSFWDDACGDGCCPGCRGEAASPVVRGVERRFVALSALAPDERLPAAASAVLPRRVEARRQATSPKVVSRVLPAPSQEAPGAPRVRAAGLAGHTLGFNCPSCFAVLVIREPEQYDGRPAPCPHCGVVIMAPRVAPPQPFHVEVAGREETAIRSALRASRWKPLRPVAARKVES